MRVGSSRPVVLVGALHVVFGRALDALDRLRLAGDKRAESRPRQFVFAVLESQQRVGAVR